MMHMVVLLSVGHRPKKILQPALHPETPEKKEREPAESARAISNMTNDEQQPWS